MMMSAVRHHGLDQSIAQMDRALCVRRDVGLVGHHGNAAPPIMQLVQDRHDLLPGSGVQVAGRFICQDQHRVVDEGASDDHALTLPPGQLLRLMVDTIAQADRL